MKERMEVGQARLRHDEAVVNLRRATDQLILMCKLKLLDKESIQDQACVVAGHVSSEHDTRVQMEEAEKAARRETGRVT